MNSTHAASRSPRHRLGPAALVSGLLLLLPLLCAEPVAAQHGARQTLDSIVSHGDRTVVELDVADALPSADFRLSGIVGTALADCRQTRVGYFCLDTIGGTPTVVRWPTPSSRGAGQPVVRCSQLPGVSAHVRCSLGAAPDGTLWLAATKNKGFSLFRLDPGGTCATRVGGYCITEPYPGRPGVADLDAVDGTAVPQLGRVGVLAIESRRNAVFYADPPAGSHPVPQVLATASDWGLKYHEELQSITLRSAGTDTYLLGATTRGRILQRKLGETTPAVQVFDIVRSRAERHVAACGECSSPQVYEIRSSATSGDVYLTDREHCEVVRLTAATATRLQFAARYSTRAEDGLAPDGVLAEEVAPLGVSIAAGRPVDLQACASAEGCTAVAGTTPGSAGARLLGIELVDPKISNVTVYRIEGIPDCRYTGFDPSTSPAAVICAAAGGAARLIVGAPDEPARQYLNVTALLPDEVLQRYDGSSAPPGGLPPLLIPPEYRGDPSNGFLFEALFVVPQKGLRFRDTFLLELDVPELTGEGGEGTCFTPADRALASLLDWDVVGNVSEIWQSQLWRRASGAPLGVHVARAVNSDCRNPTQVEGDRLSLIPYNLRVTPTTFAPAFTGKHVDGPARLTPDNDAVFARLVQSLYHELEAVRRDYACTARDSLDGSPLPTGAHQAPPLDRHTCATLAVTWWLGKAKLDKCIAAAFTPKASAGAENCQAFLSQLERFRARVPAGASPTDFANRAGELRTRSSAIRHIFETRFLPSIPPRGFCREKGTCPAASR